MCFPLYNNNDEVDAKMEAGSTKKRQPLQQDNGKARFLKWNAMLLLNLSLIRE